MSERAQLKTIDDAIDDAVFNAMADAFPMPASHPSPPMPTIEDDVEEMLALLPKRKTWRSRLFGTELVRVFIMGGRLVAFSISNIQHHRRSDLR